MDKEALINQLKIIIGEFLQGQNMDLVELIYRRQGRDLVLMILTDRPESGISLGECSELNRQIGMLLEEKAILQEPYLLEVSSPGIDRPLRVKSDFLRCKNKGIRFFFTEPINGKWEQEAVIKSVSEDSVFADAFGVTWEIPISKIKNAKQII